MKSGIYSITNLKNDKKYIGYARNIAVRWNHHKSSLKLNCHPNKYLQNSWNKYGEEFFRFDIVELCTEDLLCKKEDDWCKLLETHKKGFNIKPTSAEGKSIISPASIIKIKKALTGRRKSEKSIKALRKTIGRAVILLNDKGEYLQEFETISDAEAYTKVGKGNIFLILTGKKKSGNGFVFVYKEFYDCNKNYAVTRNYGNYLKKEVIMLSKEEEEIRRFNSVAEAVSFLKTISKNSNHSGIVHVLSGRINSYKNYKWKYGTN
jgi:group I intron endonuclease